MKLQGVLLLAIFLAPGLANAQSGKGPDPATAGKCLEAAKLIGGFLVATARRDGDALFWAQSEGGPKDLADDKRQFPIAFYGGASGTGFFLLALHRATGDKAWLDAARGVGMRLVKQAEAIPGGGLKWKGTGERKGRSIPEGDGNGLYTGNAGIGLFLLHLFEATKDPRFRTAADGAFERVLKEAKTEGGGWCWDYAFQDIIGGEAGIGLALLEAHKATGNQAYLAGARKASAWLTGKAATRDGAAYWTTFGSTDPNFSHGSSGIAFFLAALGDPEPRKLALAGAKWVEAQAAPCEGGVLWRYYSEPPPQGKSNWVMNSWCHGAPGTVRLFLLLHRLTGEGSFLKTAAAGAAGIRAEAKIGSGKPFFYNPTWCCGAAGCIDAFCSLYAATGEKRFLDDARVLADAVIADLVEAPGGRAHAEYDEADQEAKKSPYFETGFMLGNAGIGHALLRLAALAGGRPDAGPFLSDHPQAHEAVKGK